MIRTLGRSAVGIPAVGYGTMGIGGHFQPDHGDDELSIQRIRRAVDLGMTLLDTAEIYGGGHCEEVVGRALASLPGRFVLASKFSPENSGKSRLIAACEGSLRRLGVECLDLYQMHWPSADIPMDETLTALGDLVSAGKIRHIGWGNVTATQLERLMAAAAGLPVVSVQQEYSVFEPFAEHRLLPLCRRHGLTLIAYSPLGTGRLAKLPPRHSQALAAFCGGRGLTPGQAVLDWVVRHPDVCAIPMTRSAEHLAANARVTGKLLSPADHTALGALLAPHVTELDVTTIKVAGTLSGKAYHTLDQALANGHGLSPSPCELAETLKDGEMLKPVKVRADGQGGYDLYEGQLRYWAWRIAHGDRRSIVAQIDND